MNLRILAVNKMTHKQTIMWYRYRVLVKQFIKLFLFNFYFTKNKY